ncbi:hypothetical protein Misp01_30990 [Microtetraspora sp. NBRC 13810]|uniref:serine/threonine protein kinase n=1 Tax=Microtetraspora sp. NBRC 13810 TaxID=3030990 RepID=UPI0024A4C971|nr:protein kinase [Microtetraspora sp. NBRC 13810]GLW07969.1 hypothetical protein Misp01_30990 [Microtetraspora sp. NBRC 13810]
MPDIGDLSHDDPSEIGGYRLVGRLGDGVYVGERAGERVVVRLLPADIGQERFLAAVEPLRGVSAFCTAQILETGSLGGRPYLVSEFIEGPTLEEAVAAGERLTGAPLHRFAVGTMTALVALHQSGVVHGDIRPGNVVLGPDGPRVVNFGVTQASAAGADATTRRMAPPAYTAPERLRAEIPPRPAADLFSWAATVLFAASGRPPFGGDTMAATINLVLTAEPDLSGLGDLRGLVASCLAKEPGERPSASNVLLRLVGETTFLTGELTRFPPPTGTPVQLPPPTGTPVPSPPPTGTSVPPPPPTGASVPPAQPGTPSPAGQRTRPLPRRRGILIAVAAFVAGALVSGAGVYAVAFDRAEARAGAAPSAPAGTAGPLIQPDRTAAPQQSVAPEAASDRELPAIGATLHEHPEDPVGVVGYLQGKYPFGGYVRTGTGGFRRISMTDEPIVSPAGDWVALNPWFKFQNSDTDRIGFLNLATGERFSVATVQKPQETWFPTWSRDGRRLLLSVTSEKRERITGFVLVDVAARKATVVESEFSDNPSLNFAFTPDGTITRGFYNNDRFGVDLYDATGRVIRTMHWVGRPVGYDWYSPSGRYFVTVCPSEEDACVWDARTGGRKATVRLPKKDASLLGWFNENNLIFQVPDGNGRTAKVHVVDLTGAKVRLLADVTRLRASLQFGRIAR